MPLLERSGRGPWFERLEEIAHRLIKTAGVETKLGKIVASNNEVNGNMLILLSRLYWATKKAEYLNMAEQIAEVYLFEILPNNHYLPPHEWNFARNKPASSFFRLRDHGNEIIQGLSEVYLLEKMNGRPQAVRYREPLKKFLDRLLVVGRTPDGLWCGDVDSRTGKSLGKKKSIDAWGYIANAYQMFDLAEGTSGYAEEIKHAMRAAAARKSFWGEQDAYADSIESMLYLLPWFDIPECHYWVDDEIEVLFNWQSPSGFVNKHYLDGNFIRTALLYATYKTQGAFAQPWREDVYLGAAFDKIKKELYLSLRTTAPWQGLLRFDQDRHRIILNLPFDYPRLNATPEWFVVEPHKTYSVVNLRTGEETCYTGASLAQGLAVTMDEKEYSLWLKVSVI
jgi:hypothetical protein